MLQILSLFLIAVIIAALLLALYSVHTYFISLERTIERQTEIIKSHFPASPFDDLITDTFLDLHANDEIALTLCNGEVHYVNRQQWHIEHGCFISVPETSDIEGKEGYRQTVIDISSILTYDIARRSE